MELYKINALKDFDIVEHIVELVENIGKVIGRTADVLKMIGNGERHDLEDWGRPMEYRSMTHHDLIEEDSFEEMRIRLVAVSIFFYPRKKSISASVSRTSASSAKLCPHSSKM